MQRILSTYLFVKRKLNPALIADIARSGVEAVEIFCSHGHFDYRSTDTVRELAGALQDYKLPVHAIHAPAERRFHPTHESAAPLSISDLERLRRLEAVDEIKRVLDVAEFLPFSYLVQHMGSSRDAADPRRFDAAFNSLEHLHLFAKQRGVTIALENTPGELATPANLRQFLSDTRLTDLRLCLDTGHAHIADGIGPSVEAMRELLVTGHGHDNHGDKDEHLPPGEGTIDWTEAASLLSGVPLVLELKEMPGQGEPAAATVALTAAGRGFDALQRAADAAEQQK
jgi:sugar phosphate isomerase/epimerase